jgi:tRNA (adenine57-N1/adenine58-N1)-methyltransferase
MEIIKQNSPVLFYFNPSKKWLAKISKKDALHTHIGILKHADAIGKEYGSKITTNKDKYVYLLKPTMYDYIMKIQHGTQIVYPKDLGYIVARAGIQKSFVASIVKPRGHVYTFDVDENFMKIAAKNLKKCGMEKYVTQENLDIKTVKKVPVTDADVALIDLGDPWTVIPQVRQMLKGSGAVFAICPTMNQLEKLTMSLIENEFTDIESTEHILRTIDAREGKTRHSFQGIGHTTYLCFARKAFFDRKSRKKSESKPESEKKPSVKKTPKISKKTTRTTTKTTKPKKPKSSKSK